jgi:hypothetical protein
MRTPQRVGDNWATSPGGPFRFRRCCLMAPRPAILVFVNVAAQQSLGQRGPQANPNAWLLRLGRGGRVLHSLLAIEFRIALLRRNL